MVNYGLKTALLDIRDPKFTKEILVSLFRNVARATLVLIVGVALSGCVIRPLGWGWGDGGGRGGRHYSDSDREGSQGYDNSRGDQRRRNW